MSTPQHNYVERTAYPQAAPQLWLKWLAATATAYVICAMVGLVLVWLLVAYQPVPLIQTFPAFSPADYNPDIDRWREIWNKLVSVGAAVWVAFTSLSVVRAQHLVMKPPAQPSKRLERS